LETTENETREVPAPDCVQHGTGMEFQHPQKSATAILAVSGSILTIYSPDTAAREFLLKLPEIGQEEANGLAWQEGRRLLERAINERMDFAFETTLGGNTMASLLEKASSAGMEVIELLPHLAELRVFDNTEEGDPQKWQAPSPRRLLHMKWGKIVSSVQLSYPLCRHGRSPCFKRRSSRPGGCNGQCKK